MWDRFFRQRAYIGITRSRMRWYVRKNYLMWKSRSWVQERYPFKGTQFGISRLGTWIVYLHVLFHTNDRWLYCKHRYLHLYMYKAECYSLALAMADECVIKCVRVCIEAILNFMGYNLRLYFQVLHIPCDRNDIIHTCIYRTVTMILVTGRYRFK